MQKQSLADRVLRKSSKLAFEVQKRFDRDFSPVFICGVAGSGTTLLSAVLDQHYKVAANVRESARWAPLSSAIFIQALANFPDLDSYLRSMVIPHDVPARQIRSESIQLYQKHVRWPKTSSSVLDKAPNVHLARAAKLHEAFPAAKFLLIVRDPLTNIEGLRRKWPLFQQADLTAVCDFWQNLHKTFIHEVAGFTGQVFGLTFANLIQDPDTTIERIAAFLGLEAREEPLDYQDTSDLPGKGLRNVKSGKIQIDTTADAAAVKRLPAEEARIVHERVSGFYRELQLICNAASLSSQKQG